MPYRTRTTAAVLAAALTIALLAAGCAQQHNVATWQQAADQYVVEEANGDLAALADTQERSGHRVFKVIGDADPEHGADAVGVFIGQQVVDNQPWMIFLVGEVTDRELQNSQLVAVSQRQGQRLWAVGPANPSATSTYLRHQRLRHDGDVPYTGFPEEGDRYNLRAQGPTLTVTEQRSGATWSLNLNDHRTDPPTAAAATPHTGAEDERSESRG